MSSVAVVASAQTALHEKGVCVFLYVILADMAAVAQTMPTTSCGVIDIDRQLVL